jgi:HD superfamily phosphohydrolase
MELTFIDLLYGPMTFPDGDEGSFLAELISTPEVQRLRFIRLLNHDVPFMQELATSRRFAHSLGTCFAALQLVNKAPWLTLLQRKQVLAAALIHDIGVLPYGHLIERELSRLDASFSHESIVRTVLFGTYHPTNLYHQILPGASLRLHTVLERFNIDPEDLVRLICPSGGSCSAVSGPIDIDNIDNVHRMAALLGIPTARRNVRRLLDHCTINEHLELLFDARGPAYVRNWMAYREMIYSHMLGHPSCVAYNAYLQDFARKAVELSVITPGTWYLNDIDLDVRALSEPDLWPLSSQLWSGCQYHLMDYVWVNVGADSLSVGPSVIEKQVHDALPQAPIPGSDHRVWVERNKTSRRVELRIKGVTDFLGLGKSSVVVLIALIDPGTVSAARRAAFTRDGKLQWRRDVEQAARSALPSGVMSTLFPEEFPSYGAGGWSSSNAHGGLFERQQLRLF